MGLIFLPAGMIAQDSAFYSTLTGSWIGKISAPLTVTKPLMAFRSMDVSFSHPASGIRIGGTLTMPEPEGKYPAVILISGAEAQTRDAEFPRHRPFQVIADQLTRKGFAVLRIDDRGTGGSEGDPERVTIPDRSADVQLAIEFLLNHPEIDTARLGLIGQGEGGLVAAMTASVRKEVKFLVMMGSPGISAQKNLLLQAEMILASEKYNDNELSTFRSFHQEIYTIVRKNSDPEKASRKLELAFDSFEKKHHQKIRFSHLTDPQRRTLISCLVSPWFRSYLSLDPEPFISAVHCPVLAINGSLDLQNPAKENLEAIEKALIFGGNPNYKTEELPGMNHHFQTAITGSPWEYATIGESISPAVTELVAAWIDQAGH